MQIDSHTKLERGARTPQNLSIENEGSIEFLFRDKCFNSSFSGTLGKISKHQRLAKRKYTLIVTALILAATMTYGYFGYYTRKVTVKGILASEHSTSHSLAFSNGIIEEVLIKEGDIVKPGQRMFRLSKDSTSSTGATFALIKARIESQIKLIDSRKSLAILKHDQDILELRRKDEQLIDQQKNLRMELYFQQQLVDSKDNNLKRFDSLISDGAVSIVAKESLIYSIFCPGDALEALICQGATAGV